MRRSYERERRAATRTSIIAGGAVAIVALPAWSVFDHLLVPEQGWTFTLIRLVALVPLAICWALLFTSLGHRRPEWLGLGVLAPVQLAIAPMVALVDQVVAAYALGMSLAIYASGLLLVWAARYTVILVAISVGALTLSWLLVPDPVGAAEIATVAFYLLTAAAIALTGQIVRDRAAWRQFQTRCALEQEQLHTRELVAKLDRLSYVDPLTGAANRRAWDEALEREFSRLDRAEGAGTVSILLCDVDWLKALNDRLGHAVGDRALRVVAELLGERIRTTDLVARLGGDEFGVLAIDCGELEATKLAEDLRALVEAAGLGGPEFGPATLSIGVAELLPADGLPADLMRRADRRLYAAKAERNTVRAAEGAETAGL